MEQGGTVSLDEMTQHKAMYRQRLDTLRFAADHRCWLKNMSNSVARLLLAYQYLK